MEPEKGKWGLWYAGSVGFATKEQAEEYIKNGGSLFVATQEPAKPRSRLMVKVVTIAIVAGVALWAYKANERRAEKATADRALAFGLAAGPASSAKPTVKAKVSKDCGTETMAFVMSQNFVKRGLKSPSSAKFPFIGQVESIGIGDCRFLVVAYLDAQNSYGAMLRMNYSAEMEYVPNTKMWRAHNLQMK